MRFSAAAVLVLVLAGCATETPVPAKQSIRYVDRLRTVEVPGPIRTVLVPARPLPAAICEPKAANCAAMASCAEAMHYLQNCGDAYRVLDGGASQPRNGIACEMLCGPSPASMCARLSNAPHFVSGGNLSVAPPVAVCSALVPGR